MKSTGNLEAAQSLFRQAGLPFPQIPSVFVNRLKKRDDHVFSTRKILVSPYQLHHYVEKFDRTGSNVKDYLILSFSGHGVNSWAIQYYVVRGNFGMFLHLGWGGAYMDNEEEAEKIGQACSLADKIIPATSRFAKGTIGRFAVVASDLALPGF